MMPLTVYAISFDGVVRYIGQSAKPKDRLNQHFADARNRGGTTLFLRKLRSALARGADIRLQVLHEGLSSDDANALEIAEIASRGGHQDAGMLWNTHKGGKGGSSPASVEFLRKRWAEDAEFRAAQSERARKTLAKTRSAPDVEARRIESSRRFSATEAGLERTARARANVNREYQRARASETFKALWQNPEYRQARLAGLARGRAKRKGAV